MAELTTERYEFATIEDSIKFLNDYEQNNPGKKINKYIAEYFADIALFVLILTIATVGH